MEQKMKKVHTPALFASGLLACAALAGCASQRTIVLTNTSDESLEMRREGAKTAITIDPGGSTTFKVAPGEPMHLNGVAIQVY